MPDKSPKDIIIDVLNIIGYQGEKDNFANELLNICEKQALINLIKMLSNEKQVSLNKDINESDMPSEILDKYFDSNRKNKALEEATAQIIQDYIKTIMPTLNAEQMANLEDHFKSMKPTSN